MYNRVQTTLNRISNEEILFFSIPLDRPNIIPRSHPVKRLVLVIESISFFTAAYPTTNPISTIPSLHNSLFIASRFGFDASPFTRCQPRGDGATTPTTTTMSPSLNPLSTRGSSLSPPPSLMFSRFPRRPRPLSLRLSIGSSSLDARG